MAKTNYQNLFHLPLEQHYFLTHSIGLMPQSTGSSFEKSFTQPWVSGSEDIWPQWLNAISEFNAALARLLNSNTDQFCPQSNVSSGLSKVMASLKSLTNKPVILASQSDFPSTGFVLQQAEKLGFELRFIPKGEDLQSLETWDKALSSDVAIAFITQVHYNTNVLVPTEAIAQLCDARGIVSIVDSAQATGIVPIDLSDSKIDIMVGSCIKWLCGGPGAGFVWLNKKIMTALEPTDVGWFSHQNPFEFDINHFEYANNAARFWGGTPSVAAYVMARNSIDLLNGIGIEQVRDHNRQLTRYLLNAVPEQAVVSPLDLDLKGGTVVLKFAHQEKVSESLKARGILFDARQYGLRVSPHIYTQKADMDALIEGIHAAT